VSKLTERLSKIDTLELSDKINKEKKVEDMKNFILVSLYHTLTKQDKITDEDITEMLEALDVNSTEPNNG